MRVWILSDCDMQHLRMARCVAAKVPGPVEGEWAQRIRRTADAGVAPAGRRESAKGALWRFWRNACAALADVRSAMSPFDQNRDVPGGGHARASGGCYHLS